MMIVMCVFLIVFICMIVFYNVWERVCMNICVFIVHINGVWMSSCVPSAVPHAPPSLWACNGDRHL